MEGGSSAAYRNESTLEILKTPHAQSPFLSSLLIWFFKLDRTFTFTDTLQFGRYCQDFLFVNTKLFFLRPIEKANFENSNRSKNNTHFAIYIIVNM